MIKVSWKYPSEYWLLINIWLMWSSCGDSSALSKLTKSHTSKLEIIFSNTKMLEPCSQWIEIKQQINPYQKKVMICSKYLTTSSTTRPSTSQFIGLQKQPFIGSALWVKSGWTLTKLMLVFTFVTYFIKKCFV
jgi:hypothetical protein